MSVCLTEDVTIKPLIICGGCSFTHSPDSWAQVLGNNRPKIEGDWARQFFDIWKKYGIEVAGASPGVFADDLYDYWEEGDDMSSIIDVVVVGQGAAGNDLNSRVIRNVIQAEREKYPNRPIGVFWQLSGWDRIEMLSNVWENPHHLELYEKDEHMTSVIKPWVHAPSEMPQVSGHSPHNAPTPEEFLPQARYWWKSGGAGYEQWLDSPLEDYIKSYYMQVWNREYTAVKNLEHIEYTRLFCDNNDIPITIFPGWSFTWDKAINLGEIQSTMSAFELLGRLPHDIVSDIDGYWGIGEWGSQFEIYDAGWDREYCYYSDALKEGANNLQKLSTSSFEKYWDDQEDKFAVGNHPSCYIHAMFSNKWVKPKVKQMLEKFN